MQVKALVKPNSRGRNEVVQQVDGSLTVYTAAPAIEGKANLATAQLLAAYFGVPKTRVKLLRGAKSKQKVFEVDL